MSKPVPKKPIQHNTRIFFTDLKAQGKPQKSFLASGSAVQWHMDQLKNNPYVSNVRAEKLS